MNACEFHKLVSSAPHPVILLEGTRSLPAGRKTIAVIHFAEWLARRYPNALLRTGNAKGADDAFAQGVKLVDPSRLQYVLPYSGHRAAEIVSVSLTLSMDELGIGLTRKIVEQTIAASPKAASFFDRDEAALPPKIRAQAKYLLRDTLKVIGNKTLGSATAGLFYVNTEDPMKGGTGHTIRVCDCFSVPVAFQSEWLTWSEKY
jgi:hypothetical protein